MYNTENLCKDMETFGIILNDHQINQFLSYYEMLTEWNKVMNLTAITEFNDVMKKHFVDSLSIIKAMSSTPNFNLRSDCLSIIDIGTGAGFPGIPIKIVFPHLKVTLLDSLNKRIKFLNEVINKLELKEIEAVHGRAEDYAKPELMREKFDLCVSRAVANLSTLSEYCLPFVKIGGFFVSYKSEKSNDELEEAKKAIHLLGGKMEGEVELFLPQTDIYRKLIIIRKIEKTASRYPRKAGLPSREPIH